MFRFDTRAAASNTVKASVVDGNFVCEVNTKGDFLGQIPAARLAKFKADTKTYVLSFISYWSDAVVLIETLIYCLQFQSFE